MVFLIPDLDLCKTLLKLPVNCLEGFSSNFCKLFWALQMETTKLTGNVCQLATFKSLFVETTALFLLSVFFYSSQRLYYPVLHFTQGCFLWFSFTAIVLDGSICLFDKCIQTYVFSDTSNVSLHTYFNLIMYCFCVILLQNNYVILAHTYSEITS